MKLYYTPGACSLASHITAEEENLPLKLERVDLKTHKTESGQDYYSVNPKGYVPALVLDDGNLLTENVAILPFLADQRPAAGLAPPPKTMERVRLYEWLGFISSELHKAFAPFFHNDDEAHKSEARKSIERRLTFVADQLKGREFLLGQRFSVADAYFYVMLRWCDMAGVDLVKFPKLESYRKRIASRAAVQAAVKAEGLPPDAALEKQAQMAS